MLLEGYSTSKEFQDSYYQMRKNLMKTHTLRNLFLEVTLRCNARCEHCGSSCGDIIQKDELTADELKGLLKKIADHPNYNPNRIMLSVTGGEPLVRKDLFEIMEYADSLGFPWGITTNGILIDEDVVQKMANAHMYSVSVSIDGLKETHEEFRKVPGSFEKIIHGIQLMLDCPTIQEVQVTTCVNKKNIDQLEDIYQLMKDIGVKNWRLIEVDPIGRAKNNTDILLGKEEYRRMFEFIHEKKSLENDMKISYGCGHFLGEEYEKMIRDVPFLCLAGTAVGCILSNGDIFVCPDVEKRKELIQGNIRKDDFIEVWEKKYKPYRKLSRTQNAKCKNCPDWKLCGGDAFHTWDFHEDKPNFCIRELFHEEYKQEKKKKKKSIS